MPTNPYEPPRGEDATTAGRSWRSWLASAARRIKVVGIGLMLGMVFSFWVASTQIPVGMSLTYRAEVVCYVMSGPIFGTALGMMDFPPVALVSLLGWLGLFVIPAHPIRPHIVTACLTLLGMGVWFFAGFMGVMIAIS